MSETSISVVISTYNYGHYLRQSLDSVIGQTYSNWECLVVDDGSTDQTSEVVRQYANKDSRIKYLYQANQGQSVGLNRGIQASQGLYIQILDADDLLPPEKLRRQSAYLFDHPEAGIVFSGFTFFRDATVTNLAHSAKEILDTVLPPDFDGDRALLEYLVRRNFLAISAPLIRKSVFDKIGGFDEDRDAIADWDFWIRCAYREAGFHYLADQETRPLVRVHADSRSANKVKFHARTVKMRKRIQATFTDKAILRLNRILWGELEGRRGIREIVEGRIATGVYGLIKAIWNSPSMKLKARWGYCIVLRAVVPRQEYEEAVAIPAKQMLRRLLRLNQQHG